MPVLDMNIARASSLSLYMTRTTPYVNTMAGSAISGHARAAAGRPGVGRPHPGHAEHDQRGKGVNE